MQACNVIKKRLEQRGFPVNISKFLRTAFFIEHLRWLDSIVFIVIYKLFLYLIWPLFQVFFIEGKRRERVWELVILMQKIIRGWVAKHKVGTKHTYEIFWRFLVKEQSNGLWQCWKQIFWQKFHNNLRYNIFRAVFCFIFILMFLFLNPFCLFLYLLKTSETLWFSDVFKEYRNETLAWNGSANYI